MQEPFLTPRQAQVLEMQRQGMKYWEIAEQLDISESSVNVLLQRARRNLKRAQGVVPPPIGKPSTTVLSPREREVLTLKKQGLTLEEIAAEMGISPRTVKNHINIIRWKGVHVKRRYRR